MLTQNMVKVEVRETTPKIKEIGKIAPKMKEITADSKKKEDSSKLEKMTFSEEKFVDSNWDATSGINPSLNFSDISPTLQPQTQEREKTDDSSREFSVYETARKEEAKREYTTEQKVINPLLHERFETLRPSREQMRQRFINPDLEAFERPSDVKHPEDYKSPQDNNLMGEKRRLPWQR